MSEDYSNLTANPDECINCGGSGDLVTHDGEWVGYCDCQCIHRLNITAADVPESVKREIQAEALGWAADNFIGRHYDIPGGLVSPNAVFNYLQEQISKLREGE